VPELLFTALLLAFGAVLLVLHRRSRVRRIAHARLDRAVAAPLEEEETAEPVDRMHSVSMVWPLAAGAAVALASWWLSGLPAVSLALGFVAGIVTRILFEIAAARRTLRLEEQLADAIDLIVSGLRAGVGMLDALETTTREARRPLKPVLEEIVSRLRLGDSPPAVFADMADRHPLESFRLFAFTLTVHWEVGGSLAPTLATVGRTVRDRIEVSRRVRTQSAEAQLSSIGILGIVYFLALLMYRSDPDHAAGFLATASGAATVAAVVALQGIGLFWLKRLSNLPM
jgi:Flp pilus assembly protein TadB